jgi:hypothetical protein
MTQHTPGPWKVGSKSELDNVHHYPVIPILSSHEQGPGVVYATKDRPLAEADARLMAAAPDMLSALYMVIRSRHFSIDHEHNRTHEAIDIRKTVIEAIDKATGERR